jgi:hypothetical protein
MSKRLLCSLPGKLTDDGRVRLGCWHCIYGYRYFVLNDRAERDLANILFCFGLLRLDSLNEKGTLGTQQQAPSSSRFSRDKGSSAYTQTDNPSTSFDKATGYKRNHLDLPLPPIFMTLSPTFHSIQLEPPNENEPTPTSNLQDENDNTEPTPLRLPPRSARKSLNAQKKLTPGKGKKWRTRNEGIDGEWYVERAHSLSESDPLVIYLTCLWTYFIFFWLDCPLEV